MSDLLSGSDVSAELGKHRSVIDAADAQILAAFATRFAASDAIGALKREHGLPIFDPAREDQILEGIGEMSSRFSIDPEFARNVWASMFIESKRRQESAVEAPEQ